MTPSVAMSPRITGGTRLLGFIGDPVIHARSPQNFNPRIAAAGQNAVLVPMHLLPDDFDAAIDALMTIANLDGLVVTMPFKERIIPKLGEISTRARAVGAVNAAKRTSEGRWVGDIFDGVGLLGAVKSLGVDPRGYAVGLIGAGGAGAAIAFALAEAGVDSLAITDQQSDRAARLAERVGDIGSLKPVAGNFDLHGLDLLINATPVGMSPGDGIAIDVERLSGRTVVVDIVTKPSTPLLEEAARRGCRHVGGAAMVAAQTDAMLRFFDLGNCGSVSGDS
ncbi:MAG TPA: shikimate dehydrogenase [Beijerinckiaceae bacterium]|nr:shikimate dehydrogenase [Beijerinckiaceae bacterium]